MAEHVGLFLPLPQRLAKQYPPEGKDGEDTSPPHVTLCYIGDVEDDRLEELEAVVRRICQAIPPLELTLLPPRTFQNDQGQTILHSGVGCPILELVHGSIRTALERRGFNVEAHVPFKPHVTIEYIDPGERSRFDYLAPRGRWRADSVGFWAGDDRNDIPLGYRRTTHAATDELRRKVVDWFRQNPNPSDDQVHELAEQLGIDPHRFETVIYSLLTDCVRKEQVSTMTAKRDVIACMLRAGRPDLANVVAANRVLDEVRQLGKDAIDFVKRKNEIDVDAKFYVSTGELWLTTTGWNAASKKTKERMLALKKELVKHLEKTTQRKLFHVKHQGYAVWNIKTPSGFGGYDYLEARGTGIKLQLSKDELRALPRSETLEFKARETPPPKRIQPDRFSGDTFAYKDIFKRNQGRWYKAGSLPAAWVVPRDKIDDVLKQLRDAGAEPRDEDDYYWLEPPAGVQFIGKTFPVKDILKKGGARWQPAEKAWEAPPDLADSLLSRLDAEDIRYRRDGNDVWLL